MTRRAAFFYASLGSGHKEAAVALNEWFHAVYPSSETICEDLMDFVPPFMRRSIVAAYNTMTQKSPWLWERLYRDTDANVSGRLMPAFWNGVHRRLGKSYVRRLRERLQNFMPHAVFTTHIFGMSALLDKWDHNTPIYFVGTDYLTHAMLRDPRFDGWFAGSEEALRQYRADSVPTAEYAVKNFGIPISRDYLVPPKREEARRALGVEDSAKVVSVVDSGASPSLMDIVVGSLVDLSGWKVFVLCRGGDSLLENIRDKYFPFKHISVLGNAPNIADYYAASDISILDPNGVQIAEASTAGAAMLFLDTPPGLGRYNCDYVIERGAGRRIYEHRRVGELLESLIGRREELERMRYRARAMGRPHAAMDILTWAIEKADAERASREDATNGNET
jgi:processive 1,2-diacylglycerol beta-glucosyltransferase